MKRFLVFLLSLACMGLWSQSTSPRGGKKKELVVGAPMPTYADKWLSYLYDAIRAYDAQHDDVRFALTDGHSDPKKQLSDIDNFIVDEVDALLVIPITEELFPVIAAKAKKAGIPFVAVNQAGTEELMKSVTSYIGPQEIEAGFIQGREVVRALGGKGEVAILMGPLGQAAQIYRTKGVEEVFAQYPGIKVVAKQTGNWDRAKGLAIAQDWLQAYPNLKAIVSNNDEMAIGALLAARKAGLKDEQMVIVGVDATPDAQEFLGKGLDATVLQDAEIQGRKGAEIAHLAAKGAKVEPRFWIPFQLVLPPKT